MGAREFRGLTPEDFNRYVRYLHIDMKTLTTEMGVTATYISAFRNNKKEISHIAQAGLYYYLLCKAYQLEIKLENIPNS